MKQFLDSDGYQRIQKELQKAEDSFGKAFSEFSQQSVRNLEAKLDPGGQLDDCRRSLASYLSKLRLLMQRMETYLSDYQTLQEEGRNSLTQEQLSSYGSGKFWTMPDTSAALSLMGYQTYRFRYQVGKSFSADYNDLYNFQNSKVFQDAAFKAGFGELTNYGLWLGADDYTDELIQGALASMLQGIPDARVDDRFDDGVFKTLGERLSIENMDQWVSELKLLLNKYAGGMRPLEELLQDPVYQELLDSMTGEEAEMFTTIVGKVFDSFQTASNAVGAVSDIAGNLDDAMELVAFAMNDYTQQISYLDSMENALLEAGFASGPVIEQIADMKEKYSKEFSLGLDEVKDFFIDEAKDRLKDELKDAFPLLKNVDFGLKVAETAAKIAFSDEYEGYQKLAGYAQFDYALTRSYENYVELMEYGVATEEDLQEADRVFTMLRSLKMQEYDQMRTLCKGKDPELYALYDQKYRELEELASLGDEDWQAVCRVNPVN